MCPACYSALIWMISGVAATSVGTVSTIAVARQIRLDKKQECLGENK